VGDRERDREQDAPTPNISCQKISENMPEKTITINVKLFAIYQEIYNKPKLTLTVAEKTTVTDIFNMMLTEHPELSNWREITRFAINMEFVPDDTFLQHGDELVLVPPVSGG